MKAPLFREDMTVEYRKDGIAVIRRAAFCKDYFDYRPGEHVVLGGPTTRGKTTLAFDLLQYVATPILPAYVAVSKPSDPVTSRRGSALGFRRVAEWPPQKKLQEIFGGKKPSGYLVWPQFGDLETDMERCAEITRKLLMERYANGANPKSHGGILILDDTMVKAKIMGLDKEMVTLLAMAGAMKLGLWVFVQKPTDSGRTTLWGYENSTHIFLSKGGDHRMLLRYTEILGERGAMAKEIIPTLEPYQFLYVHKVDGYICIVGAD